MGYSGCSETGGDVTGFYWVFNGLGGSVPVAVSAVEVF